MHVCVFQSCKCCAILETLKKNLFLARSQRWRNCNNLIPTSTLIFKMINTHVKCVYSSHEPFFFPPLPLLPLPQDNSFINDTTLALTAFIMIHNELIHTVTALSDSAACISMHEV